MDIDKAITIALEIVILFWSDSGDHDPAFNKYYCAIAKVRTALDTSFAIEPERKQDQKLWLMKLHALMVLPIAETIKLSLSRTIEPSTRSYTTTSTR
jgi:hypothetical protein